MAQATKRGPLDRFFSSTSGAAHAGVHAAADATPAEASKRRKLQEPQGDTTTGYGRDTHTPPPH